MEGKFILFALLIFAGSIILEWIGVHKNLIFGNYSYGPTLGLKVDEIPLIIGVNWFLLIYSAGVLMQRTRIRSILIRVIVGAIILVLLDLIIEPVAQHLGYWHWANNSVPLKNYLGWFLVSGVMLFVFEKFGFRKQGMVAPVLLLVQFVFFMVLLLF
jgi:putative membrane protein